MPRQFWFMDISQPLPAMDHRSGAVGSQYRLEIARAILARVAAGETIRAITADPAMPSYATLFHWLKVHPEFRAAYRDLRKELAEERVAAWELKRRSAETWGPHKAKVEGKRWWRRGRPSSYTREKGEAVCALLDAGWAMSAINRMPGMPSNKVVYRWLKTEPEFREQVAQARKGQLAGLMFQADLTFDKAREGLVGLAQARRETARLEGRIGRLMPKVWGRPARVLGR